jgi:hypothetical protein
MKQLKPKPHHPKRRHHVASYVMSFVVTADSDAEAQRWVSDGQDVLSQLAVDAAIQGASMVASGGVARIYDGNLVAT